MGSTLKQFSGVPPHIRSPALTLCRSTKAAAEADKKPTGIISVHGVLYSGISKHAGKKPAASGTKSQHGDDATIVSSRDHGMTWTPARSAIKDPMFPGHLFGGPAFVNAGRDNEGAPDKYVYAVSTDQWDNGSNLRVGRVAADRIQDAAAWQWISGLKNYKRPDWSGDLQRAFPVLTYDRHISLPEMVYVAGIKLSLIDVEPL